MNILFLTMTDRVDISRRSIYADLMRAFRNHGHTVYVVYPLQRRMNALTSFTSGNGVYMLGVRTLNVEKTNVVEKTIGQISIGYLFKRAIWKYIPDVKFDMILYTTPPITLTNVIKYVKSLNPNAITYLLLKDIFPQNAVDLGMMTKHGINGFIYKYFRNKEIALYRLSDYIGCMSPANVKYLLDNNQYLNPDNIEIAANSIELQPFGNTESVYLLDKYSLPKDKPIFIYGGNLGLPQNVPFITACLEANMNREDCHFVIVGSGTHYKYLENWYRVKSPQNVTVLSAMPKDEYDLLVRNCQVGLIFLDHRFTIPNYPSRLLSYLEYKIPIIAATDPNTDIGTIAERNGYGYWCESNDSSAFTECVNKMLMSDMAVMGERGFSFLVNNYLVEQTYETIIRHTHQ